MFLSISGNKTHNRRNAPKAPQKNFSLHLILTSNTCVSHLHKCTHEEWKDYRVFALRILDKCLYLLGLQLFSGLTSCASNWLCANGGQEVITLIQMNYVCVHVFSCVCRPICITDCQMSSWLFVSWTVKLLNICFCHTAVSGVQLGAFSLKKQTRKNKIIKNEDN